MEKSFIWTGFPRSSALAGMLGNFLEHYDKALFGLLAPCIAHLFFTDIPLLSGMIATYAIAAVGLLTYPLGSLVFGRIGDRRGRETALFITTMGMAGATACIGFLPTSQQVGPYAWLGLAALRALQDFFIAGETKGSAIFLLEHTRERERGWMGSLCDASSMLGIFAASGLIALFSSLDILEKAWRWLFWLGGLTALTAVFLRVSSRQIDPFAAAKKPRRQKILQTLSQQRKSLLAIILASGFTYTTYTFAFTFMTSFAPLIIECTMAEMLELNTLLLVADMLLLPLFGLLTRWFSGSKIMTMAALTSAALAFPLFSLLYQPSETNILLVRIIIVILGVAFAAPFHMWALSIVPYEHRYTIISLGYAVGSKLIGIPSLAISFWLFQKSGHVLAPAAYLCATGLLATFAIWKTKTQVQEKPAFI